jgi:2-polyprenyl-3-methyl-5-hydroxy-6-metoxy-1,4-benzoquinol methylase
MDSAVVMERERVRITSRPACYLCGSPGDLLYANLSDRQFGIPGTWNFLRCSSEKCRLIWLDPSPVDDDIPRIYSYFRVTHQDQSRAERSSLLGLKKLLQVRDSYLALRYRFPGGERDWDARRLTGVLAYLHPAKRADIDFPFRPLSGAPKGRLLDVGCGGGEMVRLMNLWGWQAEGIDFDPLAVENAKKKGLTVHLGSITDQRFSDGSFDAVVMSHVIEHVSNPIQFLREAWRILRPGGRLALATPNGWSLGHAVWKRDWIHVHPPTHLFIFNPPALAVVLQRAGFAQYSCWTEPRWADQAFVASRSISRWGNFDERLPQPLSLQALGWLMASVQRLGLRFWKNLGEEVIAVGIK